MRYWLTTLGLLFGLALSVVVVAGNDEGRSWIPSPPKAKQAANEQTQCVEPVDVMRRMHGSYLKHHRDKTMHLGIRTKQYSLVQCINCHVTENEQGEYPSIQSRNHFCNSCHEYAAVKLDCFQCHATRPEAAYENQVPVVKPEGHH